MKLQTRIIPPSILLNPVYLKGMWQPLEDVAEILDEQGKHEHARALRDAITIIQIYTDVLVTKEAVLL